MPYTDLELAQMQAEALFVHDADGRMLRVNEPEPEPLVPAPYFFFSRTANGNLWRTRYDLPSHLANALARLAASESVSGNLDEPLVYANDYLALLKEYAGTVTTVTGPAYALPELAPPENAILITPENVMLLETHFLWLVTTLPLYLAVSAVIVDGVGVAACFCSRITPRVAEAGVYTAEAYRGHGYATDTVRGWATAVRATGRLPLYETTSTNFASQGIARRLGAVQYAVTYSMS